MPESIVTNTSPLLAIIAAMGNLDLLEGLYEQVLVPGEVANEIQLGGPNGFGVLEFAKAKRLLVQAPLVVIQPILLNSIDIGEASVIQTALNHHIKTVCIDEQAGRRVARLSGLKVTGSIGILIRGKMEGRVTSLRTCLDNMIHNGIWIDHALYVEACTLSGEKP